MKRSTIRIFISLTLLLAACGAGPTASDGAQATIPAAGAGSTPPAVTGTPATIETGVAAPAAPGDAGVLYGRTDEGAFFHGAPDAPVTLTDYSDFL